MSRIQLALNVPDLDAAVDFYTKLFRTEPAKRHPGYANFAVADPPLKLVLFENADAEPNSINHLGVEVPTVADVRETNERLTGTGLQTKDDSGTCCYAEQDKVWVDGPNGARWEVYTVLADAPAQTAESAVCCS